jgi:protein O-GlcNAc transferase
VQAFDRVLVLEPDNAEAFFGRAGAWRALGEHGKAGRDATEALRLKPAHTGALQAQANALLMAGAFDRALVAFTALEHAQPGAAFVACMRLFLARQLCVWAPLGLPLLPGEVAATPPAGAAGEMQTLRQRALRGEPALEPFAGLVLYDDPALHQQAAALWMQKLHAQVLPAPAVARRSGGGRLRVAYVSSDFYKHATAYLLAGVLEQHDRNAVEVVLISYGAPQQDAMRERLTQAADRWVDVQAKTDAQVAALCRELDVHVAVDLKGLTRDGRPGIFAHRAAPLQVNWLGYPGTMAAPYYDYLLADRVVVGELQRAHCSEAVAYLPHSYQPNDDRRPIDPRPQTRADNGLPAVGLVLCCFNNSFKITPAVWALWMALLVRAPGSVLWLLQTHAGAADNLRTHASEQGVDPDRLVFAPPLDLPLHLARLQLADLSLETLPYNAHTTASDALWAGVPHVTCMGQSFASRVGASLLQAAGLPELVTQSMEGYAELARALVQNPAQLQAIRGRLASQRLTAPLFDTPGFARNLERAFGQMYRRHCQGLPAGDFVVADSAST